MTKINIDTAQNVNIVAKRGDDFNLSLTIDDENGTPITFNNSRTIPEEVTKIVDDYLSRFPNAGPNTVLPNGYTSAQYYDSLIHFYHRNNPTRHVLLLTITDTNNSPALIACSETLNIGTGATAYTENALIREKDYAQAVAKVVASYAGRNNGEAQNNYGTETPGLFMFNQIEAISTTTDDVLTSIFNKDYTGYMAKGTITSTDGKTQSITFKNSDFKLQPGNYKYTFKQLNNFRFSSNISAFPNTYVFRNVKTYLTGKLKVTE